jgi:hypothetical protein
LDSLQDFKVTTNNYDAEFGSAAGALLQTTTKSGASQIHGSLLEFLRNSGSLETTGMPEFFINGSGEFAFGYGIGVNGCRCPTRETEDHFQWVSNWTKELSRHPVKFGFDFRRAQQRIPTDSHPSCEIQFIDTSTGDSALDALAAGQAGTAAALASFFLGQPYYSWL